MARRRKEEEGGAQKSKVQGSQSACSDPKWAVIINVLIMATTAVESSRGSTGTRDSVEGTRAPAHHLPHLPLN